MCEEVVPLIERFFPLYSECWFYCMGRKWALYKFLERRASSEIACLPVSNSFLFFSVIVNIVLVCGKAVECLV